MGLELELFIKYFNLTACILFTVCYSYQMLYIPISFLMKRKRFTATRVCRYGVVIAARNEENVIGHLIDSLQKQDYDSSMIDVFVIADNCTDETARVAREAGATVFEREDKTLVGKAYALDFAFKAILESGEAYDGYFIFDADNLVTPSFVKEMNAVFTNGYPVVAGYRNTKNYSDSMTAACSGLYFLKECRFLNNSRMLLRSGCGVNGTGFLIAHNIIAEAGGWNWFLLTEDVQFTVECALKGIKIGYAHDAIFYDEQPQTFAQSWRQRLRWVKGGYQVLATYGFRLLRKMFRSFYCFDILMNLMPIVCINLLVFFVNGSVFLYGMLTVKHNPTLGATTLLSLLETLRGALLTLTVVGGVTLIAEWKRIVAPWHSKLLSFFVFPFFVLTYMPLSIVALFARVKWKPIHHAKSITIRDLE